MLTIGLRIKKLREIREYSQDYMALKLKISQEQYSYLENRQKNIPDCYIETIAAVLEISVEVLESFDPMKIIPNSTGVNMQIDVNKIIINCHENEIAAYKELVRVLKEEINELKQRLKQT